jgi:hypothetical protein
MRPPRFLPTGHGGGAHVRPRFRPARYLFDRCRRNAGENRRNAPRRAQRRQPPLNDDDRHVPIASSIDHAIRLSTAAAVLAVAAIAAYVSYWHAYAVVRAHGEAGITARLEPATIDSWSGSSELPERRAAGRRPGTSVMVRPAALRCVLSRPQPLTASIPEGISAARQNQRGGPRVGPPGSRPSPSASSVTMRRLRPAPSMTRRWPRTGSACRPAIRCRNAD